MRSRLIAVLVPVVLAAGFATPASAKSAPSAYDKIQQARDAGKLTPGQAVVLGLKSLAAPGSLPKAYRSATDVDPGAVMSDAIAALPHMSAKDRRAARPFLLPPGFVQSAWLPARLRHPAKRRARHPRAIAAAAGPCADLDAVARGTLKSVPAGAHATVSYPADRPAFRASAATYAHEIRARILPTVTRLFRAPKPTATTGCNGGGGKGLQYYVVDAAEIAQSHENAIAVTPGLWPAQSGCGPAASFVLLPPGASSVTVAHETMHAVEFAYAMCVRPPALVEGGAEYGAELVYPGNVSKHQYSNALTLPFISLLDDSGTNEYGAWAFWYALGRSAGTSAAAKAAPLRTIMEQLEHSGTTFADAGDRGIAGGWRGAFKHYAVERFNQAPVGEPGVAVKQSFTAWDHWNAKPGGTPVTKLSLGGKTTFETKYKTSTRTPLSTWYQDVRVTDAKVRLVRIEIPDSSDLVQGFIQLASGKWRIEDWSGRGSVQFCRDKADENVQRIVVATSNALPTGEALGPADYTVTAHDRCGVPRVYRGTFTTTDNHGLTINGSLEFHLRAGLVPEAGGLWTYDLTSGSAHWAMNFAFVPECPIVGSGDVDLTTAYIKYMSVQDITSPDLSPRPAVTSDPMPWYYRAVVLLNDATLPQATVQCDMDPPEPTAIVDEFLNVGGGDGAQTPSFPIQKSAEPESLTGSVTTTRAAGYVVTSTWSLAGANS